MPTALARRVAGFGTTIFTEMSALAVQHSAVNLGQGFPDFPGPDFVKQAAAAAIAADLNQYAPMPGLPRLRQAVAAQWEREHGRAIDWQTEVSVTSGATEALCDAALALLDPGDKAIVFEPAYDAYVPDIIMAGATPLPVILRPPTTDHRPPTGDTQSRSSVVGRQSSAWHFDPDELRAAFEQRPKLIFVNTPHNPTGKVYGRAELELIASLCQEYGVLAITDEVYDRLLYDGAEHVPLAMLPGMWEHTLTLNSVGKTFSVTGWKIGWAVGLPALPVEGSYFISTDIGALGYTDDRAFCRFLTTEIGVAAIPTSAFYSDPASAPQLARFCFAKKIETLTAAGERLQRLRS